MGRGDDLRAGEQPVAGGLGCRLDRNLDVVQGPAQDEPGFSANAARRVQELEMDLGRLARRVGRAQGRGDRVQLDDSHACSGNRKPRCSGAQGRQELEVHLRQIELIEQRVARRQGAGAEGLVDLSHAACEEHQILAGADRSALEQLDGSALHGGVDDDHAARKRRNLEQRERGARRAQTILSLSLSTQRRSRVYVRAVVSPSPEEPAMVQAV